jgi:hypothetical protein
MAMSTSGPPTSPTIWLPTAVAVPIDSTQSMRS